MKFTKTMALGFVTLLLNTNVSLAAKTALSDEKIQFNRAATVFQKGFERCLEAHKLRASDLTTAKEQFQQYETLKSQAIEISPLILTTTEFNIDRNIKLCEKAKSDLIRAEAIPLIDKAIEYCKQSKSAFNKNNISQARKLYHNYETNKHAALNLTQDVNNVASIGLNTSRCDKFAEKLTKTEQTIAQESALLADAQKQANAAFQTCQQGVKLKATNKATNTAIARAKKSLKSSQKTLAQVAIFSPTTAEIKSVKNLSRQLKQTINESRECQTSLIALIKKAETKLAHAKAQKQIAQPIAKSKQATSASATKKATKTKNNAGSTISNTASNTKTANLNNATLAAQKRTLAKQENHNQQPTQEPEENKPTDSKRAGYQNPFASNDWTHLIPRQKPLEDAPKEPTTQEAPEQAAALQPSGKIKDWTQLIR